MRESVQEAYWQERMQEMEAKLVALRLSRRVLMELLKREKEENQTVIANLQQENKKLKAANAHYARLIWQKNIALVGQRNMEEETK